MTWELNAHEVMLRHGWRLSEREMVLMFGAPTNGSVFDCMNPSRWKYQAGKWRAVEPFKEPQKHWRQVARIGQVRSVFDYAGK